MTRSRRTLPLLVAAAIAVALGCACSPSPSGAPPPSLLLITVDTLRADHVGAYGSSTGATPTLDRLAAEGIRFETVSSASPLTLPSHASILTGLYPTRHGVRHNGLYHLDEAHVTLAERLAERGYRTAAVVGAMVLARRFGLAQGFQVYDDGASPRAAAAGGFLERDARAVTDRALAWLSSADAPFFLWVHYYDPHSEYRPPAPYAERFAERPYDGEIAFVDAEIGRLLQGLEASNRLGRTVVSITADHGESLGEHGERTHGYTLHGAALHVPWIVRGPGVPQGVVVHGLARTVDVAPTLLAHLGGDPLPVTDGRDLTGAWTDGATNVGEAYAETYATQLDHGWSPLTALRTRTHRYVRAPHPELYDLAADPAERTNRAGADPARARRLAARLATVEDEGRDPTEGRSRLDPATRRRLAALGYAIAEGEVAGNGLDPKEGLHWLARFYAAEQAFDAGDLERAAALAEQARTGLPESPEVRALLARIRMLQGRLDEALDHARAATRAVPTSARYHALLGNAELNAGRPAAAARAYQRAASLDPLHPLARAGLLWAAAAQGRLDEAQEHERVAVAQDPSNAVLRRWVGALWERAGQLEHARRAYQAALDLDSTSRETHMALAIVLAALGRDAESAREERAAGDLSAAPHLRNRLAIAYATSGRLDRAELLLQELVRTHPDYPSARRNLDQVLRQRAARPAAAEAGP